MKNCLNKVNAYRHVENNYNDAVSVLLNKRLAFGEPAVVPFYHPDASAENRVIRLAIGYGSLDGSSYVISDLSSHERVDDSEIELRINDSSVLMTLQDAFNYVISSTESKMEKSDIGEIIDVLVRNPELIEETISDYVDLRVQPDKVFVYVGDSTIVYLDVNSKVECDLKLSRNGMTIASTHGTYLTGGNTLTPVDEAIYVYDADASLGMRGYRAVTQVYSVYKTYYGCGTGYEDASTLAEPGLSPVGEYVFNVVNDGDKMFFVIHASKRINGLFMNGMMIPVKTTDVVIGGLDYVVYESVNGYSVGEYLVDVK